jgi:hypothetical protein
MPRPADANNLTMLILIFGEEHKLWSSSLHNILKFRVTSSLLGPNVLLSTLFSIIPNRIEISSLHGGEYEDESLLGYCAVQSRRS